MIENTGRFCYYCIYRFLALLYAMPYKGFYDNGFIQSTSRIDATNVRR